MQKTSVKQKRRNNTNLELYFAKLRDAYLLDICEECGDGDDKHPIDLVIGRCCRHRGWTPKAALAVFKQIMSAKK